MAQSGEPSEARIGSETREAVLLPSDADRLVSEAAHVVDSLRAAGYFFARVDSVRRAAPQTDLAVLRGPLVRLGAVHLVGVDAERTGGMAAALAMEPGDVFDLERLEADVERLLAVLEREGRPLASARVERVEPAGGSVDRLDVTIHVDPGPVVTLKRIELPGADRTASRLIGHVAGLEVGRPLAAFEPEHIRRRLEDSGLFEAVGLPELLIDPDSTAVLRIPLDEGDPGTFDLVLGYLPPSGTQGRGRIIGNGHLALRNLFGRGRALSLRLHRLPGQVSRVDAAAADPYVLGLPVGVEAVFHGLEQDSTYGKRAYLGKVDYHLAPGMEVVGRFSREVTGPGRAGLALGPGGRQLVPTAETWFLGIGMRFSRVDRPFNPRRGLFVEMHLENGRKQRTERRVLDADTTRRTTLLEQRRLEAAGRLFVPTFDRQVLVAGGEAGVLLSGEYDRSDLFRFGGAASLRGYDEERFLGSLVSRALVEYRFLIDLRSYAYAFVDVGYVDRPETPDLEPMRGVHPGYGIGIQFESGIGLVDLSAALNPDSGPTDARIHAGLSFGL